MNKEFETWWGDEGFKIVRKQSEIDRLTDSKELAEKAWEAAYDSGYDDGCFIAD